MRGRLAGAALALGGCLLPPMGAAAEEPPHVRVELVAEPELPACDRESDFHTLVDGNLLTAGLLKAPTTHVLRARFRKVPGGHAIDLTLSGQGGRVLERRHVEYVGLCCFQSMYLAAKESARMIQGEVPEKRLTPAPTCPACAACPSAARPSPASPPPPTETPSRAAPTSSAAQTREHTRIELDVGPDLVTCLDARELRRLVYELAFEQSLGPPTTNVLRVRARRTPSGGFALDIRLEEASGAALYIQHVEYADSYCCYEVLWLAALEGVIMLEAAAGEGKGVVTCPPCPSCPEERNAPRPPVAVQRRRVPARRALAAQPTLFVKGGVSLGLGVAPDPAVGVSAGLGWRFAPRFWIEADVAGTASIPVAGAPSTLAGAWTVSGSLAPCFRIDTRYGVCGVFRGGGLWPTTTEPYHLDAAATPRFVAAGVRGIAEWPLRWSGWMLRVEGELDWAFVVPEHHDPFGKPVTAGRAWTVHASMFVVRSF